MSDITGTEDMLPNLLVGAITDPLTYAGGLGGAAKGAAVGEKAGQQFGRGLEQAALARGPRYGGGAETLNSLTEQAYRKALSDPTVNYHAVQQHVANALDNPQIFGEIPKGGIFEGAGESTLAIRHPETGHVVTIRKPSQIEASNFPGTVDPNQVPPTRLDIAEMLQASRSKGFPGQVPMRVEHVPFLETNQRANVGREMEDSLRSQGMNPWDLHSQNVGVTPTGTPLVRDANAVMGTRGFMTEPGTAFQQWNAVENIPRAGEVPQGQPGMIQNALLNMLGADKSVQEELAAKLAQGPVGGSTQYAPQSMFGGGEASSPGSMIATTSIVPRVDPRQARIDRILAAAQNNPSALPPWLRGSSGANAAF